MFLILNLSAQKLIIIIIILPTNRPKMIHPTAQTKNLVAFAQIKRLPCESVCKTNRNIDHVLTCKTGGSVILRHSEIVNVTSDILLMVCTDVRKEPTLSTASDSIDEFQADISVHSFWQRLQRAFHDARVYQNQWPAITMKIMENQKKRKYNQHILDGVNNSLTPLVFTTNSEMTLKIKLYRQLNCVVKNQMLATVILVRGLNSK